MANRKKIKKNKAADSKKFMPDVEAKVEVKKLLKDERSHKIAGTILILIAFLLFISFTSYMFTWEEDQSKVINQAYKLLFANNVKVNNLLGTFGAFISDFFIRRGFGIASYLFCTFFFIVGVNLFAPKKIFSVGRNIRYVIVGLLVISVAASFLFNGHSFPWGGAVGDMEKQWLQQMIGKIGTASVLLVALLSYIIWRFNPSFNFLHKKLIPAEGIGTENNNEISSFTDLFKDSSLKTSNDNLIPLTNIPVNNDNGMNHDLRIIEKNDEPAIVKEEARKEFSIPEFKDEKNKNSIKNGLSESGLQLEVKSFPSEIEKETDIIPKPKTQPYISSPDLKNYEFPTIDLLEVHGSEKIVQDVTELENNKDQIIKTLKNYDIGIQKIYATVGPTVTLYEIVPNPGVRISRIKNLEDDIALSLAALGIRIIAPIPGKGTIGIEVPNVKKTVVSMRTLLNSDKFQNNNFLLPIAIGKKIDNDNFIVDLTTMPHLLMAGATGQGKSVGLNAILVSLLYKKDPSQLKFVLIDPKKVELSVYNKIQKYFLAKLPNEEDAIITDTKKVIYTLNALCDVMDERYNLLKEAGARNIKEYNDKFNSGKLKSESDKYLPFIVLIIDEFADLIMTAGKEIELPIARLAQLARAVGIHLIIATQRPSVNIITGTIKANFPVRIAFKVSSKIDSRTILDVGGAEQLIGKGDMLINYNGELTRLQCAFVDTPEVERIVDFIGKQEISVEPLELPDIGDKKVESSKSNLEERDALFDDAARLIVQSQSGSTSLLQRRMKLGYNRAGRLMDQLEGAGIVGPSQGSKVRDVLIKTEDELKHLPQKF